ncbi:hypothetical protein GCM10023183_16680 [Nibribacter koreensis]|uniref:TonB C-terminal domain-containing protein n=2 Tax=Nibribacter koreensis TaxID=1084519 RepID=A0ABP8FHP7_9BACT
MLVTAQAQIPINNLKELSQAVSTNLAKPDWEELDKLCIQSVVFMKFDISESGKTQNITFSKTAPPAVKDMLKAAVNTIIVNGHAKEIRGKTFLQPFIFMYEVGCQNTLEDRLNKDQFHQNLLTMLSFEEPLTTPLSCTVLPPLMQSSKW